jgi:hypothetical protein
LLSIRFLDPVVYRVVHERLKDPGVKQRFLNANVREEHKRIPIPALAKWKQEWEAGMADDRSEAIDEDLGDYLRMHLDNIRRALNRVFQAPHAFTSQDWFDLYFGKGIDDIKSETLPDSKHRLRLRLFANRTLAEIQVLSDAHDAQGPFTCPDRPAFERFFEHCRSIPEVESDQIECGSGDAWAKSLLIHLIETGAFGKGGFSNTNYLIYRALRAQIEEQHVARPEAPEWAELQDLGDAFDRLLLCQPSEELKASQISAPPESLYLEWQAHRAWLPSNQAHQTTIGGHTFFEIAQVMNALLDPLFQFSFDFGKNERWVLNEFTAVLENQDWKSNDELTLVARRLARIGRHVCIQTIDRPDFM